MTSKILQGQVLEVTYRLFRERLSLRRKAPLELGHVPAVKDADKLPLFRESTMISEKTADVAQRATAIYEEKLRIHLEATRMHAFSSSSVSITFSGGL